MWVASFDIGIKNFAFVVLDVDTHTASTSVESTSFEIVHFENMDLTESSSYSSPNTTSGMMMVYRNVHEVLSSFEMLWEQCDVLLIEQQMQHRHASNIKALKISQHVLAHLLLRHPSKTIAEFPSYHKTQVWKAPARLAKHQRKKWAVDTVTRLLQSKHHNASMDIDTLKKKDDVCDCVLMCLAYVNLEKRNGR